MVSYPIRKRRKGTYQFQELYVTGDLTVLGDFTFGDLATDELTITGLLKMGTNSSPLTLTAGTPTHTLYTTCSSTSGSTSAEPFYVKSVMTGAAGVGGRARFHMYTNVALGGWSNALKAYAEYGATGKTAGLGSALCAEITLSAGTTAGTYAPVESEIVMGAGAKTGTKTAFHYMAVSGAAKATMDTSGVLFKLDGLSVASGKLFQENTAGDATHALKIDIGGDTYYIMLTTSGA